MYWYDIQIEEGTLATQYEQYKELNTTIDLTGHEPLRKIGDVADYIDYENQRIVRNIGQYVITGQENLAKYKGEYNNYYFQLYNAKYDKDILCLCNKYVGQISASGRDYSSGNAWLQSLSTYKRFYISDDNYTTLDSFKTYLKEQYDNQTPLKVYYQLENPAYESIALPKIPDNALEIKVLSDYNISPSKIEIEYYSETN